MASKKYAKKVEEPVPEPEPEPEPEPTLGDLIASVWEEQDMLKRRKLVSEMLTLPDGPSHSLQAIALDEAMGHLCLAEEAKMNVEQAQVFLDIMETIKQNLADESIQLSDAFTTFKLRVLDNLDLKYKKTDRELALEAARKAREQAKAEARAAAEAEAHKHDKKGKGRAKEEEGKEPPPPKVQEVPKPTQYFTVEQTRLITDYVTAGVFGQFSLHRAVFTDLFDSCKKIITKPARLETVIGDGMSLEDAVEVPGLGEELEDKSTDSSAKKSAVALLVEQRIRAAQELMVQKLKENEQLLEGRLAAIESKMKSKK